MPLEEWWRLRSSLYMYTHTYLQLNTQSSPTHKNHTLLEVKSGKGRVLFEPKHLKFNYKT